MFEKIQPDTRNAAEMAVLHDRMGYSTMAALPAKADINLASVQLLETLGFAPGVAILLRAGRPYFTLADAQAGALLNSADAELLHRWFTVTPLQLPASTGAQNVTVQANEEDWVIRKNVGTADRFALAPKNHVYQRIGQRPRRDDAEEAGVHTFPSFTEDSGVKRYLDPEYIIVQATCDADDPGLQDFLQMLNLYQHQRLPSHGLFVARVGGSRHGTAALMSALIALEGSPLVQLSEPAWLGFDEVQPGAELKLDQPDQADTEDAAPPWNFALMKVADLWKAGKGSPEVLLACPDTGVDAAHPALKSKSGIDTERSYLDFTGTSSADEIGHGTGIAGLMVGNGQGAAYGLAPACGLLSIKVLLQTNVASYASRRAALMYLAERAQAGQKLVVNLSWKTTGDVAMIRTAIKALSDAGALIICSAGNDGNLDSTPHFPSDYPETISVAAADHSGRLASYSNAGPMVDLTAPGGSDMSPLTCCAPGGQVVGRIGTSFAAPQIAAAAALAWSMKPSLRCDQIREALVASTSARLSMPDLGRLASILAQTVPAEDPLPVPGEPHHPGLPFPLPGGELAARAQPCRLPAITLRIFATRETWSGWSEVAAVLGMDATRLRCLRAQLKPGH